MSLQNQASYRNFHKGKTKILKSPNFEIPKSHTIFQIFLKIFASDLFLTNQQGVYSNKGSNIGAKKSDMPWEVGLS